MDQHKRRCHPSDSTSICLLDLDALDLRHREIFCLDDHLAPPAGDQCRRTDLWLAAARPTGLDQPICIGLLRPRCGIVVGIRHVRKYRPRRGRRQVAIPILQLRAQRSSPASRGSCCQGQYSNGDSWQPVVNPVSRIASAHGRAQVPGVQLSWNRLAVGFGP